MAPRQIHDCRMLRVRPAQAAAVAACVTLGVCTALLGRTSSSAETLRADAASSSQASIVRAERRRAWDVVARVTQPSGDDGAPAFASWRRAEAVLGSDSQSKSSVHAGTMRQSAEPEIIIFTFYDESADRHIQAHRLHARAELDRLLHAGITDPSLSHNRTIPPLPDGSTVLLTAWWPIAHDTRTALPVWDPKDNPPRRHGNNYMTWPRVVAVERNANDEPATTAITFVGREFPHARTVSLDRLHHMTVDRPMADQIMQDSRTHKAAVIALGRAIEPGDSLALVAMHVASKEHGRWRWATLWWHDDAGRGVFAEDRPRLASPWNNYLLDAALDPGAPGDPDVCFNPWLEARFPDQGAGGGTTSNCIACHQRASYPPVSFLPITRGARLDDDPAYAPGRLRTDFLWSLARQNQ